MALDVHTLITRARVGSGSLRQHDVQVLEEGNIVVVVTALSAPRLWGYMLDAALAGFQEGLSRAHDGRTSTRLHQAFDGAQKAVRARADGLIERRLPDVGLLAFAMDGHILHVLCAGPARAYLHRRRAMRRLSPRDDKAEGLLKASATWCAEQLELNDLIFAGSLTAFSDAALGPLRTQLEGGFALPPRKLVEDLNKPAAQSGVGAAAISFRATKF